MKNYYEMLSVSYTATKEEIKKSYLAMLKQYHPDVFKGNKQVAQEYSAKLNVAFDTLSKSDKRLEYDKSIFPAQITSNYTYNDEGERIVLSAENTKNNKGKKAKKDLPEFSFFGGSKVSENVLSALKRTPEERRQIKKEKKQSKSLHKFAKKTKKQNEKRKKFLAKQAAKQQRKEEREKRRKSLSYEKQYQKNKRKLDVSIAVVSSVLFVIFAFLIYLNIAYR